MQAWILPAAGAGILALVIVIVLAFFFCRRALALRESAKTPADQDFNNPLDTANLLLKEQALDRFVLFQLNLFSLLWSSEHSITHTHRNLVYFRRFLNVLCVFLGLFAIGIADAIWLDWCCYPPGTSFMFYNYGTCSNPNAPVWNLPLHTDCTTMGGWIWISNVAFVSAVFLSMLIHMYLSYRFVHDVRTGLDGNYIGILDTIDDHGMSPERTKRLKDYTWMSFDHHANVQKNVSGFSPHEINLHRLGRLLIDPFAILFGYPHIVMSRSDLAVANFASLMVLFITCVVFGTYSSPKWSATCCYYDSNTESGKFGTCDDANAPISLDPFRLSCGLLSVEMAFLLLLIGTCLLVSFGLWFYTFVMFHYILTKSRTTVMDKLDTLAKTDTHLNKAWLEQSPKPDFQG